MSEAGRLTLPMPRLGETMEQGTIGQWLVAPGQAFRRGDPLLELESDKTLVEYPALGSGVLMETLVVPGDVVDVGAPIAVIETSDPWEGVAAPEDAPEAPAEVAPPTPSPALSAPSPEAGLRATPLARRIARQGGIDLAQVKGTGRQGRIEAEDVRASLSAPRPAPRASGTAPFLFVHGFAGLGSNFEALRAILQRQGHTSTAPDLPGHGTNPIEAARVDDLIVFLAAALEASDGPVHLVGHSLGAHVAACAAQRVPGAVARLTLLAPAGCGPRISGAFLEGMASADTPGQMRHLLRLLGPAAMALPDEAVAGLAAEMANGRITALAADMAQGDMQRIDTIGPLTALAGQIPVRAVFGLADPIIPKEHLFNMPPGVACHVLPTGHMPMWDAPDLLVPLLS